MGEVRDDVPISSPLEPIANAQTGPLSVSKLMALTPDEWNSRTDESFNETIKQFCQATAPEASTKQMAGFLEKHELESGSEVAVVGDIHGNDLRLDLTLKALQKRGYLDEQFRLLPGKNLVFLGDYIDRGKNSLKVLELVMALKMENPEQVHLIRGNHEDLGTITGNINGYTANDPRYRSYVYKADNQVMLGQLFKSLPVAVYMGQKSQSGKVEYVKFVHGLFHLYTDPAPLFGTAKAHDRLWVDGSSGFSSRVQNLMSKAVRESEEPKTKKLKEAAAHLTEHSKKVIAQFDDVYWLDAGKHFVRSDAAGRTTIPPEVVEAYLHISGTETAKIKEVIRGHQGESFIVKGRDEKVVVTTIDPSTDTGQQRYMEIKITAKVGDWNRKLVELPMLPDHKSALQGIVEKGTSSLNTK